MCGMTTKTVANNNQVAFRMFSCFRLSIVCRVHHLSSVMCDSSALQDISHQKRKRYFTILVLDECIICTNTPRLSQNTNQQTTSNNQRIIDQTQTQTLHDTEKTPHYNQHFQTCQFLFFALLLHSIAASVSFFFAFPFLFLSFFLEGLAGWHKDKHKCTNVQPTNQPHGFWFLICIKPSLGVFLAFFFLTMAAAPRHMACETNENKDKQTTTHPHSEIDSIQDKVSEKVSLFLFFSSFSFFLSCFPHFYSITCTCTCNFAFYTRYLHLLDTHGH